MTEALSHHATPDLRPGDTSSPEAESRLKNPPQGPRDRLLGFVPTIAGRWYCWHFFFYSLLNLPLRGLVAIVGLPAMQTFTLTNALLTICVVRQMLYATRYPLELQLVGAGLFIWSSARWYFAWPHPEVMTCAFVFMSLIAWFHERRYQAILLTSLAAMQNPPLFLLSLFYLLPTLFRRVPHVARNVFFCGITSFWVIVPPLFYRYHFGVGSLIADFGYLDRELITFTRFWGFFFDLDQGMIISLPTALPMFLVIYVTTLVKGPGRTYNSGLMAVLIGMTFFIMPAINWNHGQAGINRYATWCSMIPLAYLIELVNPGWTRKRFVAMTLLLIVPQAVVVQHYGGTQVPGGDFLSHKQPALLMLEYFPRRYNPDPQIFLPRTNGVDRFASRSSAHDSDIVAFTGRDGNVKKIAVRRGSEQQLLGYGWNASEVQRVAAEVRFINDWAYLHPGDFQDRAH